MDIINNEKQKLQAYIAQKKKEHIYNFDIMYRKYNFDIIYCVYADTAKKILTAKFSSLKHFKTLTKNLFLCKVHIYISATYLSWSLVLWYC